jgi:photosystem II stability/assembly factor-like uncharacterized protein
MWAISVSICILVLILAACDGGTGPSPAPGIHGWIVGQADDNYATILHTSDGVTWERQGSLSMLPNANLSSVSAVDSLTAWAAGGLDSCGVVLRTLDGGVTWSRVGSASDLPFATLVVSASSADEAWVGGYGNMVVMTTDGGQSWTDIADPEFNGYCWSGLCTVGPSDIWLCGVGDGSLDRSWPSTGRAPETQGIILHTMDGGITWRSEAADSLLNGWPMITVAAWDTENAWVAGHGFSVLRTTDGGESWALVTPDSLQQNMNDANGICLLSAEDAWVSLDNGRVWRTIDGGASWDYQPTPTSASGFYLTRINALDPSNAWIAGRTAYAQPEGIILSTTDGGNSWIRLDDGSWPPLWDVGMVGGIQQ